MAASARKKYTFPRCFEKKQLFLPQSFPKTVFSCFAVLPFLLCFPFPADQAYIMINHSFPHAVGSRQIIFRLFSSAAGAEYPPKPLVKCETTAQEDGLLYPIWVRQKFPL